VQEKPAGQTEHAATLPPADQKPEVQGTATPAGQALNAGQATHESLVAEGVDPAGHCVQLVTAPPVAK
jgi:hypothetical protein